VISKIDTQVQTLVKACYEQATTILKDNRILMDYFVDLLIEEEVIEGEDFEKIVGSFVSSENLLKYKKAMNQLTTKL